MRKAFLVFFVALAARTVPVAFVRSKPDVITLDNCDTEQYRHLALNMLERGLFSSYPAVYFVRRRAPYEPEAFRLPGYPLFLALSFALFGPDPWFALVLQALITSLGAVALLLLGERLFGPRAGLAAGLLYALEPLSVTMNAYIFADALLGGLLAFFLLLYWKYLKSKSLWPGAALGGFSGLLVWVKPWPVFLIPVLMFLKPKKSTLLALLSFGALVGGWAFRNWRVFGVFTLSGVPAYNLYVHRWGSVYVAREGLDPQGASVRFGDALRDSVPPDNALRMVSRWGKRGLDSVMAHPLEYAKAHFLFTYKLFVDSHEYWAAYGPPPPTMSSVMGFLFGQRDLNYLLKALKVILSNPIGWAEIFSTAYAVALFVLALLGLARLFRRDKVFALAILLGLLYFILTPGPSARSRMRTAWVPLAAVAAGAVFVRRD